MNARFFADRRWLLRLVPIVTTSVVVLAAVWAGLRLWDHYELAPWTRDGRVTITRWQR